ncbi:MAG: hypothetical protein ACRDDY_12260 [Clostridium sp.]|uniref:hypothetical protein n=1 Tax=Clostridium sp. TaxID=1506 RepID=UPI003EE589EF
MFKFYTISCLLFITTFILAVLRSYIIIKKFDINIKKSSKVEKIYAFIRWIILFAFPVLNFIVSLYFLFIGLFAEEKLIAKAYKSVE